MPLESLSPETVYATKGNVAYPATGGIDGVQTAAALAGLAQKRIADAQSGNLGYALMTLTTALTAGSATTSLVGTGGTVGNAIPQSAIVAVISGDQINTFVLNMAAGAPVGTTTLTVTSATPTFSFPIGSTVVWGYAASVPAPVVAAQ